MKSSESTRKLQRQVEKLDPLKKLSISAPEFKKWIRDTEVAIERIFGRATRHLKDFTDISYSPMMGGSEIFEHDYYLKGLEYARAILI